MSDWGNSLDKYIDDIFGDLRTIRRYLHTNPEPSGEEFETTLYLSLQLNKAGIRHQVVPSQRGIIAESLRESSAPRVAMRADMDALRIQDEKDVEYKSSRPGIMHACGHDAHSTMVLGATLALAKLEEQLPWPCPWRAVFQPAEETAQGALEMIEAGAVENTRAIISLHVDPDLPVGHVGLRRGELTAACQNLEVVIEGKGGHAARPHISIDPVAAAVHFISDVYQLVPRGIDSRDPEEVTFGVIQGGDKPNAIPDKVRSQGTIRTLSKQSREDVAVLLQRISRGVAEVTDTKISTEVDKGCGAVVNDDRITELMWQAATEVVGPEQIHFIPKPSMGAEDFSEYLHYVPGCLLRLGVAQEGKGRHTLHSPRFDIDEHALTVGAKILARTLVSLAREE